MGGALRVGASGARSPADTPSAQPPRSDAKTTGRVSKLARHRVPAKINEAQVDALVSALDALLVREEPFAIVIELDDEVGMTAPLRRKLALALDQRARAIEAHCAGLAFVARTPTATGAHTAIRWLAPTACPERVFTSVAEAEAWARGHLDRALEGR